MDYLDIVTTESSAFINALVDLDAPVPQCGDWTIFDLGVHVGSVWQVATANVVGGGAQSPPADPWNERERDGLFPWLQDTRARILEALAAADPDAPAWSFAADQQTGAFWLRRMAHETVVHRWDAESAHGETSPIDPMVASDGIDEYTMVGLRWSMRRPNRIYPSASFHLHCTDVEGEWTLVGDDGPNLTVTREHAKGDAAARGTAEALLLWIWGRNGGDVQFFGDESVAHTWRELAP